MKYFLLKSLLLIATLSCFGQPRAKIEKVNNFKSKYVKSRTVEIWLPPEYSANTKDKFPVLYMQDGQNVFNPETSMNKTAWEADDTAAKMIAQNQVKPFIIVAIWNTDQRFIEYFPEKASKNFTERDILAMNTMKKQSGIEETELLGDEYLKFLTEELKPYIDKKYRTMPKAASTAICGSSMGALISLYAVCEYPDVFGQAACISTHWPILLDNSNLGPAMAVKHYLFENLPAPDKHRIYFDHGTATLDRMYEQHQNGVDNMMKLKGYEQHKNWLTRKYENAPHNEKAWHDRFNEVLLFLYRINTNEANRNRT